MPDFYDIQDTDDTIMMIDEDQDFTLDDLADFVIDEDEVADPEQFIVEEPTEPEFNADDMIPGSPIQYIEEEQQAETPKTWEQDSDHSQFVSYVKDKMQKIPRHSGETVPGCDRAKAFLKSLDNEISKAMRTDLNGLIDEQEIDKIRKHVEDMSERLDRQIIKLRGTKKASMDVRLVSEGHCDKCEASAPMWNDTANDKLVCMSCDSESIRNDKDHMDKTAGTPSINVYVSAFERAIVGTMINSKVSAGRNIEETYEKLKNKYNFSPREELAIQQLVSDYGYHVYKDRGLLNEPSDQASGDGVDWQTNYHA